MKIIRSKGTSYTRDEGRKPKRNRLQNDKADSNGTTMDSAKSLSSRGLVLSRPQVHRTGGDGKTGRVVEGAHLPDFMEEVDLFLRLMIQQLDRTLIKPRSMKRLDLDSYIARTHLSEALWVLFENMKLEEHTKDITDKLKERWRAKIHPYAKKTVNWKKPYEDENAKLIEAFQREAENKPVKNYFSQSRWSKNTFKVPLGSKNYDDYEQCANSIWEHLFIGERSISEEEKTRPFGKIQTLGRSISDNATDPRLTEHMEKDWQWSEAVEELYCRNNIAIEIASAFLKRTFSGSPKEYVGKMLYEHFGTFKNEINSGGYDSKEVWNLHYRVRQFYRRLIESTRFRIAFRASPRDKRERAKLFHLLPNDMDVLLERVRGKRQTSRLNRRVRLGKLIAHSIDLCSETAESEFNKNVNLAMDYYNTSTGQGDIKRNEAFVRVIRRSVAFSIRSLHPWSAPGFERAKSQTKKTVHENGDNELDHDLTSFNTASLVAQYSLKEEILRGAQLIFGTRPFSTSVSPRLSALELPEAVGRSDFLFGDGIETQEMLWAFLRLAALVRNQGFHFNTKKRLLRTISTQLLDGPKTAPLSFADTNDPKTNNKRNGNAVEKNTLRRLEKLIDFDQMVDATSLALELNRLKLAQRIPAEQRASALDLLSHSAGTDDVVTPKFISLLTAAVDLANIEEDKVSSLLRSFKGLNLSDLSKDQKSINSVKISLLRLFYDRSFANWLDSEDVNQSIVSEIRNEILKYKRERRSAFKKQTGQVISEDETISERLLNEPMTLAELLDLFQAESLYDDSESQTLDDDIAQEQASNPYVPNRKRQSDVSNALENLRREVFAHFFGKFLVKKKLLWIFELQDTSETAETQETVTDISAGELLAKNSDHPAWLRQFYAWLYLVPPDQIALLRNQFRKTAILERKGAAERMLLQYDKHGISADILKLVDDGENHSGQLKQLDAAMSLYCRVQAAGFSGQEHVERLQVGRVFYQDPTLFQRVYCDAAEDHLVTMPGTRSGLRQILRYNTLHVLESIFKKHAIGPEETELFEQHILRGDNSDFVEKQEVHQEIVTKYRQKDLQPSQLEALIERYQRLSEKAAQKNFKISAARLTEFANIQHLLMDVLARLADFTAIWERDKICLLLGLAFERNPGLLFWKEKSAIAVRSAAGNKNANVYTSGQGFVRLDEAALLTFSAEQDAEFLWKYFGLAPDANVKKRLENPKDKASRERINQRLKAEPQGGNKTNIMVKPSIGIHFTKRQIRNDLAHFNILDWKPRLNRPGEMEARKDINLSYILNAVRSLLSYDQKLKNSVPAAISEIVAEHGMIIDWEFGRDRLRHPVLSSRMQTHLSFLPPRDGAALSFEMPCTSPRQLSMTTALFDFGSSGNTKEKASK